MTWKLIHPRARMEHLGLLVDIFTPLDPRPAREQAADRYQHGGGWNPFKGFMATAKGLSYPGDPLTALIAEIQIRDETIRLYEHAWVGIFQADGSYEISRMD